MSFLSYWHIKNRKEMPYYLVKCYICTFYNCLNSVPKVFFSSVCYNFNIVIFQLLKYLKQCFTSYREYTSVIIPTLLERINIIIFYYSSVKATYLCCDVLVANNYLSIIMFCVGVQALECSNQNNLLSLQFFFGYILPYRN